MAKKVNAIKRIKIAKKVKTRKKWEIKNGGFKNEKNKKTRFRK